MHQKLDTVGFGIFWIRLDMFCIRMDAVGYCWIRLDSVGHIGFALYFWLDMVGYGWILEDEGFHCSIWSWIDTNI